MCNHSTCRNIKNNNKVSKVSVLILNNYYGRGLVALMKKYKKDNIYKLAGHYINSNDHEICYIELIKKITEEQYKINIDNWKQFDDMFKTINNSVNYFCCGEQIIFIGIANNIHRSTINDKLNDGSNVEFFNLNGKNINTYNLSINDNDMLRIFGEIKEIY